MAIIKTVNGFEAIVDDQDYAQLVNYRWRAYKARNTIYVSRSCYSDGNTVTFYMHRDIMQPDVGVVIDHIDRNGLNNSRSNLRVVSVSQNAANSPAKQNVTGYRGVEFRAKRREGTKRYRACVGSHPCMFKSNYFATPEEAARVYDAEASRRYGDCAQLNFPRPQVAS